MLNRFLPASVLIAIIVICLVPELALYLAPRPGYLRGWLIQNFAFWPGILVGGWKANYQLQPALMFVTYAFLHANLSHFLFNMITLISLGRLLVSELGTRRFVILYACGVIGGGIGYALLSNRPQPMVGASGALFGLAGALLWLRLVWDWHEHSPLTALHAVFWPVVMLIGINVVMYFALNGQIAWETHLGGFLAGVAAMAYFERNDIEPESSDQA